MTVLRNLFLEDPRTIWVVLGIAEFILLASWTRGRTRWKLWALIALPVAGVLVGLLDWAVETDYEKVRRSVRTISQAAKDGDADRLIQRISDSYESGRFRKKDLAGLVRWGLLQVTVQTLPPTISFEDDRGIVRQTYLFTSTSRASFHIRNESILWEGTFEQDPDGEWRLRKVMMLQPFERQPEEYIPNMLR